MPSVRVLPPVTASDAVRPFTEGATEEREGSDDDGELDPMTIEEQQEESTPARSMQRCPSRYSWASPSKAGSRVARLARFGHSGRCQEDVAPGVHRHQLRLAGGLLPATVDVVLDVRNQHTLSWASDISWTSDSPCGGDEGLPSGSCNLYLFPACTSAAGVSMAPQGNALAALEALIIGLATDPGCKLLEIPDFVGAFPPHAIAVANTRESTALASALYAANPQLLRLVHVNQQAGTPLFTGESVLHICAVRS